jgi:ribosomal protein S2
LQQLVNGPSSHLGFDQLQPTFIFQQHLHIGNLKKYWSRKSGFFLVAFRHKTCLYNWSTLFFELRRLINIFWMIGTSKQCIFVFLVDPSISPQAQPTVRAVVPSIFEKWVGGVLTNFKTVVNYLIIHQDLQHSRKSSYRYHRYLTGILVDRFSNYPVMAVALNNCYLGLVEAHAVGIPTFSAIASDAKWVFADQNIGVNTNSLPTANLFLTLLKNIFLFSDIEDLYFYKQRDLVFSQFFEPSDQVT